MSMVKKYAIGGINNVIGADYNQTQLNPNYGLFEPNLGGNVGKYQINTAAINNSTDNQTDREQPTVRERNFNFADFTNNVNNYSKFNYSQFNPYYRPNPAFQTGLAFGVDASPAAKIGTTSDLVFQSLFNLSNKLQPFFQDSKLYKNQDQLRSEQTRGSQRVEQAQSGSGYKNGGQIMYQNGPPFTNALDPTALAPNEIQLKPSDTETTQADLFPQLKYDLFPQPQTDFVPFEVTDPNLTTAQPVRQEPSRATAEENPNKAANIIGATAAVGSFGMDLAKGIAGGIGVGRRSAYAYDRAQEKMREATINQGFEKGREDLFNQGYLQTTGFLAQNGGQTPIVVSNPNDPTLNMDFRSKWLETGGKLPNGEVIFQSGGAIPVSMNGLKEYPKQEVIVPSNNITMKGINYDVLAFPNNDQPVLMKPDQNYQFPNSTQVLEKPMMKNGGMIKLEEGVYFDPTTQDFIIENTNNFQNGGSVSELYTSITGNSWNQAKIEGLTDGSYDKNMKLRSELLNSPESFSKKKIENQPIKNNNIEKASNFTEAFNIARNTLGPNNIFEYNGKKYGTNIKGESFNPDKEILDKFNLNSKETNKRLEEQNKLVKSPFSTKSTVKVEPTYEDWEVVRERNKDLNKLPQIDIIKNYNKNNNSEYLILDKSKGKMHLFKGDKEIKSYNVGIGQNKGDEQTKTVIRDAKVQWDEGNKKTGAGIYTVSNVNESNKQFNNSPSWIFKNEQGIEVPMVIHGAFGDRVKKISDDDPSNDRVSNGCINGLCYDLKELYNEGFGLNETLYVLAEDEGNKFEVSNGKLVFKSASSDVNKTVKTLNYKPIKVSVNKDNFAKDVFQWNDFNDEEEYDKVVLPYVAALQDYKQDIMKVAKINGDVYNDIVKVSFGILGTESNFGDTHSAIGNFTRAVNKGLDPKNSSSPDYVSKSTTYGANKESNSVGLTQIRFNQLDAQELKALKTFGISTPEQLLTPKNAAIATAVILGIRYNNQLTPIEKENLLETLPTKWNNRDNYSDRVNSNSRYLTIKELN